MIITTSWDDGDHEDLTVLDLLNTYGIRGTFYIAQTYRRHALSDKEIRLIAATQEIGAHTLTHPDLSAVSEEVQEREIRGSKQWLESVTGSEVSMFCYPGGKYTNATIRLVKESGYKGARTTARRSYSRDFDPYEMGVSMTCYPRLDLSPLRRVTAPIIASTFGYKPLDRAYPRFEERMRERFDEARAVDGIFHLYGHSWANAMYGLYPAIERLFEYIAQQRDCEHLTNGGIIDRYARA